MDNKERKKQLKEAYKQYKPDMGVFLFTCKETNHSYIGFSQDLRAVLNGLKFKLGANGCHNKDLQKEWSEYGEAAFSIEILDRLDYDKDEAKTDYSEELALLQEMWKDKLPDAKVI